MSETAGKYSITMPRDIAQEARERGGQAGLSSYVSAAVARQIERDKLHELIAMFEADHGPTTPEEIQAARDALAAAHRDQMLKRNAVA